jgi:predicted RNA binding protein YcfA (HicA-like mRNA interferase family)
LSWSVSLRILTQILARTLLHALARAGFYIAPARGSHRQRRDRRVLFG